MNPLNKKIPAFIALSGLFVPVCSSQTVKEKPNIVFVLADQWRAQATGYNGNPQVQTPNIDKLAAENVNFTTAIASCPVSSPTRASLLTGQYPLTNGIFFNDKPMADSLLTIAEVLKANGYATGYIGKWHLNGHPKGTNTMEHRKLPVPKERRQGFDYWKVLECTHDYNNSMYYDEQDVKHYWKGYDAEIQTDSAIVFIKKNKEKPFYLYLSWGPPHAPYLTAPEKYRELYSNPNSIILRENVPAEQFEKARAQIAGYYAHCTALDEYIGRLQDSIKAFGLDNNTIFVFTSDHGDMLFSHNRKKKQQPWNESIMVPFILKYPDKVSEAKQIKTPFVSVDIMPTLLGLCHIDIPESVEGTDFSGTIIHDQKMDTEAGLIMCPVPFHQWSKKKGGREYRGVRTERYTYCRDLNGPWLLYDNHEDPYQLNNLVNTPGNKELQQSLEEKLNDLLKKTNDEFKDADYYMNKWDYSYD
jgi:arylsulfatase A-like enzyme